MKIVGLILIAGAVIIFMKLLSMKSKKVKD